LCLFKRAPPHRGCAEILIESFRGFLSSANARTSWLKTITAIFVGRNPEKRLADDQLAELATLLGHVPITRVGQDRGASAREGYAAQESVLVEPGDEQYSASDANRYDEYDHKAYDQSDDHADGEEYEEYSEGLDTHRRRGFVFVAAIFGLAVLGTAGAFAYRAMFGGPMLPTLPSIIKAEGLANKIIPGYTNSLASNSPQTDANAGSAAPGSKPDTNDANGPLSIVPSSSESSAATTRPRTVPAQQVPLKKPPANETASAPPVAPAGGYAVQVSSQRSEKEAPSSFRDLQAKYPNLLGGRTPTIRRADLGAKGIYYRTTVGPFASADEATELCSNLKAAGGSCLVQKN